MKFLITFEDGSEVHHEGNWDSAVEAAYQARATWARSAGYARPQELPDCDILAIARQD